MRRPIKRFAKQVFLAVALLASCAYGADNSEYNYPGGIAELRIDKQSGKPPEVKFGLREPVLIEYKKYWRILIGLDLTLLPGEYVSYVKNGDSDAPGEHKRVLVRQHAYPFIEQEQSNTNETIWPLNTRHSSFSEIDFSNTQQPSLPLKFPFEGDWSNNFGHKIYNPQSKALSVPNAISLTTTQLGTVIAPQNAIVSKIDTTESGLSTVFLDHGRGLYSVISGLSDLTVALGNGIVAGAVIGKLATGEESGQTKQLRWQTVINGAYVNPIILTEINP